MKTSESIAKLAEALSKAQGAMEPAAKDSVNPHFRSRYADFASVTDALRKPLAENGLSYVQGVGIDGDLVTLTTRLLHASGEWVESTCGVRPQQAGPQAVGSAISYLRRYALSALVGLASEEDDDANAASAPRAQQSRPAVKPAPQAAKPAPGKPVASGPPEPPPPTDADAPPPDDIDDSFVTSNTPAPTHDRTLSFGYGTSKGKPLSELSDKDLQFYRSATIRSIDDPEKERWKDKNVHQRATIEAEIRFREGKR